MDVNARYQDTASHALAGFQLVEESLKDYIGYHYDAVRELVAGKLSFLHERSDVEEASLGKLLTVFRRLNANSELIGRIQALIKTRNDIAHRALTQLYRPSKSAGEMEKEIDRFIAIAEQLGEIMSALLREKAMLLAVKSCG